MKFCYDKLKGKIKEKMGTQNKFAIAMGISIPNMSDKLNNKSQWSQEEINRACVLLAINSSDIPAYFFEEKVKET